MLFFSFNCHLYLICTQTATVHALCFSLFVVLFRYKTPTYPKRCRQLAVKLWKKKFATCYIFSGIILRLSKRYRKCVLFPIPELTYLTCTLSLLCTCSHTHTHNQVRFVKIVKLDTKKQFIKIVVFISEESKLLTHTLAIHPPCWFRVFPVYLLSSELTHWPFTAASLLLSVCTCFKFLMTNSKLSTCLPAYLLYIDFLSYPMTNLPHICLLPLLL